MKHVATLSSLLAACGMFTMLHASAQAQTNGPAPTPSAAYMKLGDIKAASADTPKRDASASASRGGHSGTIHIESFSFGSSNSGAHSTKGPSAPAAVNPNAGAANPPPVKPHAPGAQRAHTDLFMKLDGIKGETESTSRPAPAKTPASKPQARAGYMKLEGVDGEVVDRGSR